MAINESIEKLRTTLSDITTSLGNKGVTAEGLKASQVPDKIREIETKAPSAVYGIEIIEATENSYDRVVYTDNAVGMKPVSNDLQTGECNYGTWKDKWMFDKIYPAMVKANGTIDYKLNPDDQTKKATGGASDISNINYDGNAMVVIEKFYTKFGMDGENETIQISDLPKEGFEPIGFIREDESEADFICLPMFGGNKDSSGKLRSIGNQSWTYDISWTDSVTAAEKNGSGYGIESFAMNQALSALFIILMKSCNPQTALGEGRIYSKAKTGVLINKGAIAYDISTKTTKFMWVEDFTSSYSDGMWRWETGFLTQTNKLYVKMKPPYSGTETSGFEEVTDAVSLQGKYLSKMKCSNKYGRYPIEGKGSNSTYECSSWYANYSTTSSVYVSRRASSYGVWGRNITYTAPSYTSYRLGAALTYLPPK